MSEAFQSILSMMAVIAVGYLLAARGWFTEDLTRVLARLVVEVSLPFLTFSSLLTSLDRETLGAAGIGILVPFAVVIGAYLLSLPVAMLLKVPAGRRGVFRAMFTFSNSVFLGMPVNLGIFGQRAVPFVLMYYLANTSMFWTVGVEGIRRDSGGHGAFLSRQTLRNIFNVTFLAVLVSLAFVILDWKPPKFVMDASRHLGSLTTPLSMIFVGTVIRSVKPSTIRLSADTLAIIVGRFVLVPLVMFFVMRAMPVPDLMRRVFVIEAAMPIMTQTAITAKAFNSDAEFASLAVTVTTALSIVIIPLYMLLFTATGMR